MVLAMRLHILVVLMVCICFALANPVYRRQEDNTNAPVTTTSRTTASQTSSTVTGQPTSSKRISDDDKESGTSTSFSATGRSTATTSPTTSQTASSSRTEEIISAIPSNANGAVGTNFAGNGNYSFTATPYKLPLEPKITPAFIIGGILLVLTGAAYTLIGVKNKWVHSFFSATYLGALCVTVLIVYVMSLPVSNAVQGAYLVAIALTGLILGAAATIFAQMTETLGCLLGGFCVSMWVLVLKPGGLIESQTGRAILIAVTTAIAFGTAFSHYTRQYGLVAGTSFAGATAVVMGIDCFSRAGLKEFWAYLWDLNTNLFPVGATSYPVTKGMKVEIAAIIVIFLGGIVSQLELWKVIQERRQNRVNENLQDDGLTDLEQAEEDVARRIADRILRERKQWEEVYGDKVSPPDLPRKDSGIADVESQRKVTTSIHRSGKDSIEMSPLPSPNKIGSGMTMKNNGGAVTIQVARDNIEETRLTIEEQLQQRNDYSSPKPEPKWVASDGEQRSLHISSKYVTIPGQSNIPKVVPLPFQVPKSVVGEDDDGTSVATFADEDARRHSKHLSASSTIIRKLSRRSTRSSRSFTKGAGESSEDLMIPRAIDIEEDRGSSLAATMDGLSDDEDMPSPRSSIDQTPNNNDIRIVVDVPEVISPISTPAMKRIAEDYEANKARPFSEATESTNILDFETLQPSPLDRSLTSSTDPTANSQSSTVVDGTVKEAEKPIPAVSRASISRDQLPSQLSKVAMSYRTNEWAKHLERADNPELEELKHVEYSSEKQPMEATAPVDMEGLQQTSNTPVPRSISQISNRPPLTRAASKAHPSQFQPTSVNGHYQDNNLLRSMSQQSLSKNLLRASVASSIADSSMNGELNLGVLGKRDSIVRTKQPYYANNAALVSMPEFPRRSLTSDGGVYTYPNRSTPAFADDDDNISLSARRSLIRQSSGQQSASSFNSHQPKRTSTTPSPMAREQQLASWRASLTQDLPVDPKRNIERSRGSFLQERQLEEQKRVHEARAKAKRESLIDERMRSGNMIEAHRDALRKMQAKANKAVT